MKQQPFEDSFFSTPKNSPGFLLWQVTNTWQRLQKEALSKLNLTHVQFVLLAGIGWLKKNHIKLNQKTLSNHARTDPMMTSQVLRKLEQKGFIKRETDSNDTRSILIKTTKTGKNLITKAIQVVEKVDKSFFNNLGSKYARFTKDLELLSQLDKN